MRTAIFLLSIGIFTLTQATGCAQRDRAKTAPPTLAELPSFTDREPLLPINVGVEGAAGSRGYNIVPHYTSIEPTPEEQEILGVEAPVEVDELALYQPPPDPSRGLSRDSTIKYSINEAGGVTTGVGLLESRFFNYGYAGRYYGAATWSRSSASAYLPREASGRPGISGTVQVGENLPRSKASHETKVYR